MSFSDLFLLTLSNYSIDSLEVDPTLLLNDSHLLLLLSSTQPWSWRGWYGQRQCNIGRQPIQCYNLETGKFLALRDPLVAKLGTTL